jgi:alkanesulfonate monooxygenase
MQTMRKSSRVGSNGGTAAGLVGSYETVAARIREFHKDGIELFMLQFQPLEAEMQRFAEKVFPLVKAERGSRTADVALKIELDHLNLRP